MVRLSLLLSAALMAHQGAEAHMELKYPAPRRSRFNPLVGASGVNYDNVAPLAADGSQLPCKRYARGLPVATLNAGEKVPFEVAGGTFHGGGHCQFTVSYDDVTFVALRTDMKNCFTGTGLKFDVTLPATIPACDRCTVAWSWVNAVGNRELYMNCADVRIVNTVTPPSEQQVTGRQMTIANQPSYPTIPEFPQASMYDGADIYAAAPIITVRGPGLVQPSTAPVAPSASAAASSVPVAPSTVVAPSTSSVPVAPSTVVAPSTSSVPVAPSTVVAPSSSAAAASASQSAKASSIASQSAKPSSSALPSASKSRAVAPSASAAAVPSASQSAKPSTATAACTIEGATNCAGISGYTVCNHGSLVYMQCPAGTGCEMSTGWARCSTTATAGTDCVAGNSKCFATGVWGMCSHGMWYKQTCAPGTQCRQTSDSQAECTW